MSIIEMRQNRAKLAADAQALIPKDGVWTPELRTQFDKMMADVDTQLADITRMERSETTEKELRAVEQPPNATINTDDQPAVEQENESIAFRNFLRCGIADAALDEKSIRANIKKRSSGEYTMAHATHQWAFQTKAARAAALRRLLTSRDKRAAGDVLSTYLGLLAGSPPTDIYGGVTVPDGFFPQLEIALKWYGEMLNVATLWDTATGEDVRHPTSNNVSEKGHIVGESTEVDVRDLVFSSLTFGAFKYTSDEILVSIELLQDSAFNIEGFIRDEIAKLIGRILNEHFTVGTGTGQPNGIVTAATTSGQTVLGNTNATTPDPQTEVGYKDLVNLEHSVDKDYRKGSKFMFHDSTLAFIKTLDDKQGRPLWVPGVTTNAPDRILGYEYSINNDMEALGAGNKSVLFGQLSKYKIRRVLELTIQRLVETHAKSGAISFLAFARYDGDLIDAGTHPVKYLINPS